MKTQGYTLIELMVAVALLGIAVSFGALIVSGNPSSVSGATAQPAKEEPGKAERALRAQGFKAIQIGGVPLLGCGDGDSMLWNRSFTATNSNGMRVSGNACCGHFKGCTIRF